MQKHALHVLTGHLDDGYLMHPEPARFLADAHYAESLLPVDGPFDVVFSSVK